MPMLKRTLVFSNPMSLSLKNCQLVLAFKDDPDNKNDHSDRGYRGGYN